MAENVSVCDVDPSLNELLKKFRFKKSTGKNEAIVMKVDKEKQMVVLEEEYEDYSLEELAEELPSSQPRFVAYSYVHQHDDGRVSYPLCFIFVSPQGCKTEQQVMYAGSMKTLVEQSKMTKVFEIRSVEDMTEEWLLEKLKLFR